MESIFPAAKGGNRYLGWMERASVSGVEEEDFYIWGGRRGLLLYLGWVERTFTWGGGEGSISGVEGEDF